jgi:hypothetical protein
MGREAKASSGVWMTIGIEQQRQQVCHQQSKPVPKLQ